MEKIDLPESVDLEICAWNGNSTHCIYLNSYRVAGEKPWGGGRVERKFHVRSSDVLRALFPNGAILAEVQRRISGSEEAALAAEVERLRSALDEVIGCFHAAEAEGIVDRMAEQEDQDDRSLYGIVNRRLKPAYEAAANALAQQKQES
ncbi:hypothetical protein GR211_21890 [Rhizobium leguminosarum]|uniref:hypothetical protein n=1 Tax=Rhizobium ruizarguesonis TaxID=2081791 RepID=UPI0013BAB098|nr:hypothetical protein [Rhizobium ruizarguesonis]NEJ15471.1 hypothetical protein [Rhizobium ruizarguesonis]NEK29546.1 hypothetical protein [Rhizobium ruizarguesonis]